MTALPSRRATLAHPSLVWSAALGLCALARGQQLPPGHVRVDDMVLPVSAVSGDGHLDSNPWNTAPDANIVPYEFNAAFAAADRADVLDAMAHIEAFCGIRFLPKWASAVDWVEFEVSTTTGVSSSEIGRRGGRQRIWIWPGVGRGVVMHEIMHTLAFHHEHMRSDRNTFVTVNFANIDPAYHSQFTLLSETLHGAYDFESLMHYGLWAFSIGGQSMTLNVPFSGSIGQRSFISPGDGAALRTLHGAPPQPVVGSSIPYNLPVNPPTAQTLTLFGSHFFKPLDLWTGRNTATGTRVFVNSTQLIPTILNKSTMTVTIPTSMLTTPGTLSITVQNPQPGIANTVSTPLVVPIPAPASATSWWGSVTGFGEVVQIAGDLNGDGVREVLVGNPGNGSSVAGRVDVMSPVSGTSIATVTGGPGSAVATYFGRALANLGDVNGDNVADFAVGHPNANLGLGEVQVFSGATRARLYTIAAGSGSVLFLGSALATLDDLNGDGVRELAIGAPGFGGMSNLVRIVNPALAVAGTPAQTLQTISMSASDSFGGSLAYLGSNTLAVGSPTETFPGPNAGRFTLYSLTSASTSSMIYTRLGNTGQRLGASLAAVGDLDVNGSVDVAVGASGLNTVYMFSGVPGGAGPVVISSHAATAPGTTFFGQTMASLTDVDGDGFGDVAANSSGAAGTVRLISGKTGALIKELTLPAQPGGWRGGLAGGVNVFGDGPPNLVTGAPAATGSPGQFGFVQISAGATTTFSLTGCSLTAQPPTLTASSRPILGTNYLLDTNDQHTSGGPFAAAVAFSNPPTASVPLGACTLFLNPSSLATLGLVVVNAGSSAQFPVAIPSSTTFLGDALLFQSVLLVGQDFDTTNVQVARLGL